MGRFRIAQTSIFLLYFCLLLYILYQGSVFLSATSDFLKTLANQKSTGSQNYSNLEMIVDRYPSFRPSLDRFFRNKVAEENSKEFQDDSLRPPKDFSIRLGTLLTPQKVNCSSGSRNSDDLVVILKSRPQEYFQRQAVRQTWGKDFRNKLTFVIGCPSSGGELGEQLQAAIRLESEQFGDILLVDFVDTYYNLSLKFLASLNYISSQCSGSGFYLYGDTDAILYPDNVKEFVRKRASKRKTIYGLCWKDARVFREGKW